MRWSNDGSGAFVSGGVALLAAAPAAEAQQPRRIPRLCSVGSSDGHDHRRSGSRRGQHTCLYSLLDVDGRERDTYTYLAFHERTRHLAQHLAQKGLLKGDRALLVYPPGLELIAGFVACARIGVIPVPVYPPTPMSLEMGLTKLAAIASDCAARAALTTRAFHGSYQLLLTRRKIPALFRSSPAIPGFVAEMTAKSTRHDPVYPLIDFFNRSHAKLTAMQYKRYDNSGYRAARGVAS